MYTARFTEVMPFVTISFKWKILSYKNSRQCLQVRLLYEKNPRYRPI